MHNKWGETHTKFDLENLRERVNFGDTDKDGSLILKWTLENR
jgi:hypothetical protein